MQCVVVFWSFWGRAWTWTSVCLPWPLAAVSPDSSCLTRSCFEPALDWTNYWFPCSHFNPVTNNWMPPYGFTFWFASKSLDSWTSPSTRPSCSTSQDSSPQFSTYFLNYWILTATAVPKPYAKMGLTTYYLSHWAYSAESYSMCRLSSQTLSWIGCSE